MHTSVESATAELMYRGKAKCVNGEVEINLDEAGNMTGGDFRKSLLRSFLLCY